MDNRAKTSTVPGTDEREYKQYSFGAQCKMVDDGDGGFDGTASPFGKLDDADDIIVAGTYRNTIPDFLRDGWVAADHKWGVLHDIGIYTGAKETDTGLYVAAEFHGTPDAQAVREKVRKRLASGKSVKLSIGFVTLKSESMPGKDAVKYLLNPTPQEIAYCESRPWVRVIFEVKLYEVSLVSVPAARQADVLTVKSMDMHNEQQQVEQKQTPKTQQPAIKAAPTATIEAKDGNVLGEWVERDMTCRAIGAVMDALWYLIYDCIYPWPSDNAPPIADRLAILSQGWMEGLALVSEVINAILGDEAAESQDGAVEMLAAWGVASIAERKDGKIERKNIGMLPAGVPLQIHSERVLAAATGLKNRLSSLHNLRLKEGRQFSQANCDRIEEHCKALDAVIVDLRGMLAGESSAAADDSEAKNNAGDEKANTAPEAKAGAGMASPGLQALIRSKYNEFMESESCLK